MTLGMGVSLHLPLLVHQAAHHTALAGSPACAELVSRVKCRTHLGDCLGSQVMYNGRRMSRPRSQWRSREFGFVNFAAPEDAARAIVAFNGAALPGVSKERMQLQVQFVKGPGAAPCEGQDMPCPSSGSP
jgi:hypothetical protein